jgi:acetyl-CoA C-acetyltransferase
VPPTSPTPQDEERIPVVAVTGQTIERDAAVSPADLAERAAEIALSAAPALRKSIDVVSMVNILSGGGPAPGTVLAKRLSIEPRTVEVSTVGGNSPQWLVSRAASAVAAGEARAVLLAGAEAQSTKRRLRAGGVEPHVFEDAPDTGPDAVVGEERAPAGAAELTAGLVAPLHLYALFESVIAHRAGRSYAEHRTRLGELLAPFTEVAAKNPFAWFREALAPSTIATVSPANRLVSEPYTKKMCAIMQVDQAAAVVVCSLAAARAAGLEADPVFCWAGADTNDVWFPAARRDLGTSKGIAVATSAALAECGVGVDDLSALDLYSCFPCAVEMAAEALGIATDDARGLTVTGGLPYFGGPGNDYTLHSIATMTEKLRESGEDALGMVTGLGWYVTKHSVGVYGASPPPHGWRVADTSRAQRAIDASAAAVAEPVDLEADLSSAKKLGATVLASTLAMGRDGEVTAAPVIAALDDGRQTALACGEKDTRVLSGTNLVGERVEVFGSPPRYRVAG